MKIRIVHCLETIASGGVEQVRLTLIKGLDKAVYEHIIICTWAGGPISDELKKEGVEIFTVGSFKHPFHLDKYQRVIEIVKGFRPHIIHGAVFEGMSMATVGGFFGRVPVKIIEETSDPQNRSKKAILLQKLYSIASDKVIAISPAVLWYLENKVKVAPRKAILINNGVRLPKPEEPADLLNLRKILKIEKGDFVVGAVGRVYDNIKRFSDLILAIALIRQINVKLLLVGTGPDLEKLKELVAYLKLEDQFISVGYQENPNTYYSLMDSFCIPSAHEGFGLVAVEAMLHRLPVVATDVGGLKNIVIDNETGFLAPPFSPEILAEKLKVLIENPGKRKEFGERGYERALGHFSSDRYCKEVEDLYLALLKEKGVALSS